MESKGISIILYPRSYNKRGHHSLHSVQGVTPDGREVNVKLRLDERHLGQEYAPSIAEFAREDRKATRACIASSDNGPDNREGILLFTQAIPDSKSNNPQDTYIAKWASVLAEDSESPEPYFGFARMQISKNSAAVMKLRAKLKEAVDRGDSPSDIMALESRLQDTRNYSYPAIFYYPELGASHEDGDKEEVFRSIAESVSKYSRNNLLGGCLLRWTDSDQRVDPDSYREVFPRFDSNKNAFETPTKFAQRVLRDFGNRLVKSQGGSIEIIPLIRINTGQATSAHYGQQNRYKSIERLYYDDEGFPLLCRASAKVTYYEHNGRTYLSRLYALTEPLGDPRRLSFDGQFNKLFIGEKPKLWISVDQKGEASEVPAGLSLYKEGTNLSIDFFFSKEKYLAAYGDQPPQTENTKTQPSNPEGATNRSFEDHLVGVASDNDKVPGREQPTMADEDELMGVVEPEENFTPAHQDETPIKEEQSTDFNQPMSDEKIADEFPEREKNGNSEADDSSQEATLDDNTDNEEDESGSWLSGIDDETLDIPEIPEISDEDEFFKEMPTEDNSEEPGITFDELTPSESSHVAVNDNESERSVQSGPAKQNTNHGAVGSPRGNQTSESSGGAENEGDSDVAEDDGDEGGLAAFLNL